MKKTIMTAFAALAALAAAAAERPELTAFPFKESVTSGDYAFAQSGIESVSLSGTVAADEATVQTTLAQSDVPLHAESAFLGREVSYMPDSSSVRTTCTFLAACSTSPSREVRLTSMSRCLTKMRSRRALTRTERPASRPARRTA